MDNIILVTVIERLSHHLKDLFSERLVKLVLFLDHYIPEIINHLVHDQYQLIIVLERVV